MKISKVNENYLVIEYILNIGSGAEMDLNQYQWHKKNFRGSTMYYLGKTFRYIDSRIDKLEETLEHIEQSYILELEPNMDEITYPYHFLIETNEYDYGKKGNTDKEKIDILDVEYEDMVYLIKKEIKKLKAQLAIIDKEIENF